MPWGLSSTVWVLIITPTLILVSWLRKMHLLANVSIMGQAAMIFGLSAAMGYAIANLVDEQPDVKAVNLGGFPVFFGMVWFTAPCAVWCFLTFVQALYTFEGIGLVMPMRRAMRNPDNYLIVLDTGFVIVALMVLSFGTIGYIGFGDDVSDQITLDLPPGALSVIIKVMLILAIWATYPVQMWPVRGTLGEVWRLE